MEPETSLRHLISEIHASDSRRIFAYLVRQFGDFDLAEDALQEAFAAAVEQWLLLLGSKYFSVNLFGVSAV